MVPWPSQAPLPKNASSTSIIGSTSPVPAIAYVSCNPASFARDAATLVAGGYRLKHVTPIDQFTWSPHLELVGIFEKN